MVQEDLHVRVLIVAEPFVERDDSLSPPQAVGELLIEVILPADEPAETYALDHRIQVRMVQHRMHRLRQRDVPEKVPGDVGQHVPVVAVMVHHGEYPQAGDVSRSVVQPSPSVGEHPLRDERPLGQHLRQMGHRYAALAVFEAEDVGIDVESGEQPPEQQDLGLPVRYDHVVGSHRDHPSGDL